MEYLIGMVVVLVLALVLIAGIISMIQAIRERRFLEWLGDLILFAWISEATDLFD